jgi:hypothetical protein
MTQIFQAAARKLLGARTGALVGCRLATLTDPAFFTACAGFAATSRGTFFGARASSSGTETFALGGLGEQGCTAGQKRSGNQQRHDFLHFSHPL